MSIIKDAFDAGEVATEHIATVEEAVDSNDGQLVSREVVVEFLCEEGYSSTEATFLIINAVGSGPLEEKNIMHEPNRYGVKPGIYLYKST